MNETKARKGLYVLFFLSFVSIELATLIIWIFITLYIPTLQLTQNEFNIPTTRVQGTSTSGINIHAQPSVHSNIRYVSRTGSSIRILNIICEDWAFVMTQSGITGWTQLQ